MIIANKELLDAFVQKHAQSAGPLNKWVEKVKSATWHNLLYLCNKINIEMIIANKELLDAFVQKHAQSAGPR